MMMQGSNFVVLLALNYLQWQNWQNADSHI